MTKLHDECEPLLRTGDVNRRRTNDPCSRMEISMGMGQLAWPVGLCGQANQTRKNDGEGTATNQPYWRSVFGEGIDAVVGVLSVQRRAMSAHNAPANMLQKRMTE